MSRVGREQYRLRKFLIIILLLVSCAKKTVEIDIKNFELADVITRVKEAEQSVKSVQGLASIRIESPNGNVSYKQVTIAEEPNLLRIEALAPFGRTAGMLISDGEKVSVIFPKERTEFDNIKDFNLTYLYPQLPVGISLKNLVNLFLGRLPEDPEYDESSILIRADQNQIVLTLFKNESKESVLWVNPENYRIERAVIKLENGNTATCEFKDFIAFGNGVFIPRKIELKIEEYSIRLKYDKDVRVNSNIDRDLFNFRPSFAGLKKISQKLIIDNRMFFDSDIF